MKQKSFWQNTTPTHDKKFQQFRNKEELSQLDKEDLQNKHTNKQKT